MQWQVTIQTRGMVVKISAPLEVPEGEDVLAALVGVLGSVSLDPSWTVWTGVPIQKLPGGFEISGASLGVVPRPPTCARAYKHLRGGALCGKPAPRFTVDGIPMCAECVQTLGSGQGGAF